MKVRRYKLWWSGKKDGVGGVGVVVKEELCKKALEVRRVSDRVMTVVVFEDVLKLICGHTPQNGRSLGKKKYSTGDLVICLGDFNGHINGVHGGHGVGQRNLEGRMLLVLSGDGTMCVKYMA